MVLKYSKVDQVRDAASNAGVTVKAMGASYPQDYLLKLIEELAEGVKEELEALDG